MRQALAKPEKNSGLQAAVQAGSWYRRGQPRFHYWLRSATCAARSETILASLSSTVLASAPYPNRREDALIGPAEAPSSRPESSPHFVWRISARSRRIRRGDGMFLLAFGGEMQIYGGRPGKRGASERLSGQWVEIFGKARTLDQRQAVVTDPGGQVGAPAAP
jgi:hypothetical protein